jgi:protein disulfide-isomerase A6
VKRVDDKTLEAWLAEANDTAKAILFTDKGKTSALLKSIAIEFKGSISVAQIRNTDKEKASLELFGITNFPTLILLPGGKEAEGIVYDGELTKEAMVAFLSQAAAPNPDPAPAKVKLPKSKDSKKATKDKASKSKASSEGTEDAATATDETLEEDTTESPSPEVETEKPLAPPAPPISLLTSEAELTRECLGPRTGTCILALLPETLEFVAYTAVGSLSEVAHRHKLHKRTLFPFYAVSSGNPGHQKITHALGLKADTFEIVAVNARRGWWRHLPSGDTIEDKDVSEEAIENWVETIRLGDGVKQKLPAGLVPEEPEEPVEEESVQEEPIQEQPVEESVAEETLVTETVVETQPGETKTVIVEQVKAEETPVAEPHDEL